MKLFLSILIIWQMKHLSEFQIFNLEHSKNRTVKGVNILNCLYHVDEVNIPVAFEINARLFQTSYQKNQYISRSKNQQRKTQERHL